MESEVVKGNFVIGKGGVFTIEKCEYKGEDKGEEVEMSWRCTSTTMEGLVNNLWKHGLLSTPRIKEAMLKVDRGQFSREMPYEDSPQRIGYDATISGEYLFILVGLGREVNWGG